MLSDRDSKVALVPEMLTLSGRLSGIEQSVRGVDQPGFLAGISSYAEAPFLGYGDALPSVAPVRGYLDFPLVRVGGVVQPVFNAGRQQGYGEEQCADCLQRGFPHGLASFP